MTAIVMNGNALRDEIVAGLAVKIAELGSPTVCLATVLVGDDGALGESNDVTCVSLEHKMGIHASPTAVMSFGDADGAVGYLIGEENHGMRYMFTMMNVARLQVGLQAVGVAERAYRQAVEYAFERKQGRAVGAAHGMTLKARAPGTVRCGPRNRFRS